MAIEAEPDHWRWLAQWPTFGDRMAAAEELYVELGDTLSFLRCLERVDLGYHPTYVPADLRVRLRDIELWESSRRLPRVPMMEWPELPGWF